MKTINPNTNVDLPPIVPVYHSGNLPLSLTQTNLWFLDQLEPNSAAYNIPIAYRLTGKLNVTALEESLREIVNRHESLRTTFTSINGEPQQLIAPDINFNLPIIDLVELPETAREIEVQNLIKSELHSPFHLEADLLFRVKLLRIAREEHILLVTMHQIIFDGWSLEVFQEELTRLYQAFYTNQPSPFAELPIQYHDFALWQRNCLTGEVLASQLSYWKKQLGGQLPVLDLPTDYPRPAIQTSSGKQQSLVLSPQLTVGLKTLSQSTGVTLFMTLLAGFQILLYRYSGQEDIIVGTLIPGRKPVETEGLIGLFANTLALRTNLAGNPSFSELLERVRQVALGADAHQEMPFEKLIEELQPERDLSRSPLFQVMFVLENTPQSTCELPNLTLSTLEVDKSTARFDLTLNLTENPAGIKAIWSYNTDLFDGGTITRMMGHFQTLLEGIVANPYQSISQLPLLTREERHQILVEWNDTRVDYPQDKCIHQLFEEQVERTPEAVAVVFEDRQLTYRQLNCRANQLAHYLQKLGVKPEVLVGICVERSLEMVVGLLAILKAGGAYVPLDPAYPQDRLDFMLEDTQIPVLLTTIQLVETLPSHQANVICLDRDWTAISHESSENLISTVQLRNLGYVIYTSGSTGKPKGVAMMQLPLFNLILWHLNHPQLGIPAKTVQFAPLSFDVSFQEIFSTWCSGGTLVLISEEMRKDAIALLRFLHQNMVERLFLPFVALQQLAEVAADSDLVLTNLSEIITAGEQLQITPAIAKWFSQLPASRLHNHYGPSESHVVTAFTLTSPVSSWSNLPPIGCPIDNTQIYILNSHLEPVPVGIPGELYIGGDGLARGYLNRPELTAEKFIPNPFDRSKSDRLYKTGDLSCYLPDGNIEYLGRIDNQVKIRGFRIELGEIESVLAQAPHVRETVAIVREDVPGDKRLVAYIIPQAQPAPTTDELRRFLKQQLPDYMVPSAFVILDAFPLTPNGKVDRRALPVPEYISHNDGNNLIAPRDELEQQLTQLWEKVLNVKLISINSNFFDLGGHSILAVKLFAQIRNILNKDLPISTLFQAPTIAELANIIRQEAVSISRTSLVAIQPKGSKKPFFFHGGSADALSWAKFARLLDENQPFYALQRPDLDGKEVTEISVEQLAAICLKEIRTIQPQGPYLLGGHCFGGTVAFEMAQQLHSQGEEVDLLALFDAYPPPSAQLHINRNSWSFLLMNSFHKFDYWLQKTYYYHGQKLFSGGLVDKLQYIRQKLAEKKSAKQEQQLGYEQLKSQQSSDQQTENTLSHQLRYLRAEKLSEEASINYKPQVYPGKITLLMAKKQSDEWYLGEFMGWDKLTSVGVDKYEIPGLAGNLFNKDSAPLLAEQLKLCLGGIKRS